MTESVKPMNYGATDLRTSLEVMLLRAGGANYSSLHKNAQRIQELGKARAKLEKVIATGRDRLAAIERKGKAHAGVQEQRIEEVKRALLKGEKPDAQKMIAIAGRLSELEDPEEDFPCKESDLRAALASLEGELQAANTEYQGAMQRGKDLARSAALDEFGELEVIYQDLFRQVRLCMESMFVQAAIAGAFFDGDTSENRRRSGGDTRNPTMLKALNYLSRTSAVIDGNYAQGLRIDPVAVLAEAETDIERIVKDFADYGALSITPIGTHLSTDKAMRKRVEEIEKNRQLMGI